MNPIDSKYDQSSVVYFENIDRIINAERITKIEEMKKLVRFVDHLIQNIINQILNNLLSEKGAKIKILQLFNIIQHCMVGNHPAIKPQINRLLNIYEQTYKNSIYSEKLKFEPTLRVLESKKIEHYVESIIDTSTDPIYSEIPKISPKTTPNDIKDSTNQNELENEKNKLSDHFISTIHMKIQQKSINFQPKSELEKKKKRVALFAEIKESLPKNVFTTR